jgi:hypothetical protein
MDLVAAPLVAMEGYYSKFTIFTGATSSTKDANIVPISK